MRRGRPPEEILADLNAALDVDFSFLGVVTHWKNFVQYNITHAERSSDTDVQGESAGSK